MHQSVEALFPLVIKCPGCSTYLHRGENVVLKFGSVSYWKCHVCGGKFSTKEKRAHKVCVDVP